MILHVIKFCNCPGGGVVILYFAYRLHTVLVQSRPISYRLPFVADPYLASGQADPFRFKFNKPNKQTAFFQKERSLNRTWSFILKVTKLNWVCADLASYLISLSLMVIRYLIGQRTGSASR